MGSLSTDVIDRLGERYGEHASWAVWSDPASHATTGGWVSDLSVLDVGESAGRVAVLHGNAVLVALNSGVREGRDGPVARWAMFHDRVGRDFMLAQAVRDTPWWGAYVTDFFKGVPTRDGHGLAQHLNSHPEVEPASAAVLRDELDLLGTRPLLVCLGRQVEPFVRRHFDGSHDVVRVSHYSRAMTKVGYRDEFARLLHHLTQKDAQ